MDKHGISFADAEGVFYDPLALSFQDNDAVDERRYISVGLGSSSEILVVVWTERSEDIRLISARRATRKERKAYEG